MRKLLAGLAMLAAVAAPAYATNLNGPLISIINTDKGRYLGSETPIVNISLQNDSGATWSGSVDVTVWSHGIAYATTNLPATLLPGGHLVTCTPSGSTWSCPAGSTTTLTTTMALPSTADMRGYQVNVRAWNNAHSAVQDSASGALDVGSDWNKFGRECFVTNFQTGVNHLAITQDLNARHCNIEQYYSAGWKQHVPKPPAAGDSIPGCTGCWYNLENIVVDPVTLNGFLSDASSMRITRLFYQLWTGAFANYATDGSGVSLNWGEFMRKCVPASSPCTAANDQVAYGAWGAFPLVNTTNGAGLPNPPLLAFKTPNLYYFNPNNTSWQSYLAGQLNALYAAYAFDGTQFDTTGEPYGTATLAQGHRWDINGNDVVDDTAMATFTTYMQTTTGKPAVFNNVSRWDVPQLAQYGGTHINYTEIWSALISGSVPGNPQYGSLAVQTPTYFDIADAVNQHRRYNSNSINIAAYLDTTAARQCRPWNAGTSCYLNANAQKLIDGTIMAAGAWHQQQLDYSQVLTYLDAAENPPQLKLSSASQQALLDYDNFAVGHENLLRDGVTPGFEATSTTGATASDEFGNPISLCPGLCNPVPAISLSTNGAAGQVWAMSQSKAGFQILHLLNYTYQSPYSSALTSPNWDDTFGNAPAPQTYTNIGIKMYYAGAIAPGGHVYWASPDYQHGLDLNLAYTTGSDAGGNFVTFTVPYLRYWSMVWLETDSKSGQDYHINPFATALRGGWANSTSPGTGTLTTTLVANTAFANGWGRFDNVDFGAGSSTITLMVSTTAATSVQVLLDSPTGTLVATVALPNTGGLGNLQTLAPVAAAVTGTHHLYFKFTGTVPAEIWTWKFT